jgi:hypothetical protein
MRRFAVALLAISVLSAPPAMARADSHAAGPAVAGWSIVPSANADVDAYLKDVTALSATDAWAVGIRSNDQSYLHTLIEHWDGTAWHVVASPNPSAASDQLFDVEAVSASDVWAVGVQQDDFDEPTEMLIEHWDGTSWKAVPGPSSLADAAGAYLQGLARIPGSTRLWAVGGAKLDFGQPSQPVVLRSNGTVWKVVASPSFVDGGGLQGVAAIDATHAMAVGSSNAGSKDATLAETWNGSTWTTVATPNPKASSNRLEHISLSSRGAEGWAVGTIWRKGHYATLAQRWDGSTWSTVATPSGGKKGKKSDRTLTGVVSLGPGLAWAVGVSEPATGSHALIERWDGAFWVEVAAPDPGGDDSLAGLGQISGTDQLWAVGLFATTTQGRTLTLRYG